jgi:hypothetical protein
MKKTFILYLKNKSNKQSKLHNAELNMAKKPQVA